MSAYYDLDAILAEEERVPTTFLRGAQGLGALDSGSGGDDLQPGARVELPIWIADVLAARTLVTLEAPRCYASRFRTYLLADPVVVNLRERSPHFYETGLRLASYVRDAELLCAALLATLAMRFRDIVDKAQSAQGEDVSQLTRAMTDLERRIFAAGFAGARDQLRWKRREGDKLTSVGARAGAKRKRDVDDQ